MKEKPYLTAAEERAILRQEELAEDLKWEAEHGGHDGGSDRDCDRDERHLDQMGGSIA